MGSPPQVFHRDLGNVMLTISLPHLPIPSKLDLLMPKEQLFLQKF